MRKILITLATILLPLALMAQTGGIKATVVSRAGRAPIANASVSLLQEATTIAALKTTADGQMLFENIPDGRYTLEVEAVDYIATNVNVIVEKGLMRDLVFVTLSPDHSNQEAELDASSFAEFDLDDSGYSDAPTILFSNNDVFTSVAGYGFSSIRFKNRGYNSETQDVYLAGVPMNDAITGYSPFSLWSGLNEAMRSKDSTLGLETSNFGVGRYNGLTNITATPESVRPGWRFSLLSNSALYRLRLMATYASGELDNGWSYAVNVSARLGGNDWVEGLYYRSFAIYAGVSKRFNPEHKLSLVAFTTPGQRGAQNASTQEVYDLMGDNLYNSNWGYQNGKVRNARERRTNEPIFILKHDYTPSDTFKASATLLYRTGFNGYSALDWYDAMDPRPDYYRNLPSYSFMEDEDYNRQNLEKAEWATLMWSKHTERFANYQHLNWDRLYNVNYNNAEGRSKYALEERRVDQNDLNLAINAEWVPQNNVKVRAGLNAKYNRSENYKKMKDLLGGNYYLNIDSFAERDFASNQAIVQNDLDYFLANGAAEKIAQGGKYGYDYLAQIRKARAWASVNYKLGAFTMDLAGTVGVESFWREGLLRKGLFAGLDDNGNDIFFEGRNLTIRDKNDEVITSKGKSQTSTFLTYSAKIAASYDIIGGHRISYNAGIFNDAPTFNQAFVSARTRNSLVENLTTVKTLSTDLNYQYSNNGYNARVTAYYTNIWDQTDVMSSYDDSQHSFTNYALTGIGQRHIGLEAGVKVPLFLEGLTASGVLSWGEYIYTTNPHMVQTMDNSAEILRDEDLLYWKSHPIYEGSEGDYRKVAEKKHYVPSTPQFASEIALNYRTSGYLFVELNAQYFAHSYLDMNPLYRTEFAILGPDGQTSPDELEAMAKQEEFSPAFIMNASIGKSWYINRKHNFGFSLEISNILNNRGVKTGGYEQTRLISSQGKDRYYRFDPKYFYMPGVNYMLNLYYRF